MSPDTDSLEWQRAEDDGFHEPPIDVLNEPDSIREILSEMVDLCESLLAKIGDPPGAADLIIGDAKKIIANLDSDSPLPIDNIGAEYDDLGTPER